MLCWQSRAALTLPQRATQDPHTVHDPRSRDRHDVALLHGLKGLLRERNTSCPIHSRPELLRKVLQGVMALNAHFAPTCMRPFRHQVLKSVIATCMFPSSADTGAPNQRCPSDLLPAGCGRATTLYHSSLQQDLPLGCAMFAWFVACRVASRL